MANKEHRKILEKGTATWNRWREDNPDILPDLSDSTLDSNDFTRVNFKRANLSGADLTSANLNGANLSGANLSNANLFMADASGADLSEGNLSGANLVRAIFNETTLSGASFAGAVLRDTMFASVDLSKVQGLDKLEHLGRSEISIRTIFLSQGKIPVRFLEGAGVAKSLIEYMHSLAVKYCSCFISYSSKDQDFADQLYADLRSKGVNCWFATYDAQGGKKIIEQIDTAIRLHERVLLILSPHSIESTWVKTEIITSIQRETKDRPVLFPIRLNIPIEDIQKWRCFDADLGKDLAEEIRKYHIPDFTCWKEDDSYQKLFEKLLHDLQKEEIAAGASA